MERRTFLLGIFGGLVAATGLAAAGAAQALPAITTPPVAPTKAPEAADISPEQLDQLRIEEAQYGRRRRWRRHWRRRGPPRWRRHWRRRASRRWRRGF